MEVKYALAFLALNALLMFSVLEGIETLEKAVAENKKLVAEKERAEKAYVQLLKRGELCRSSLTRVE